MITTIIILSVILTVSLLVDPKGSIPTWVVNLLQKKWPYKTLMKVKEIAEAGEMPVYEPLKKYFK